MPRVKIQLRSGYDSNLVEVDGHDMTSIVAAVQFGRTAAEPLAHVTLHLRADQVELDADLAEVVMVEPALSPGKEIDEMLANVDPGELEQAALARIGGMDGGPQSTAEAFIAVLREMARD